MTAAGRGSDWCMNPQLSFPERVAPLVSIVIPTMGRDWGRLDGCLDAVLRNTGHEVPYKVLVVANGAGFDFVSALRERTRGVCILAPSTNLGFAGGCNVAARSARGQFIVFLNDDTEAQPGWLAALVETADAYPEAGAIGSAILFPDRTVQEIGSVVWSDGSTIGIARGRMFEGIEYDFVRRVDYCSACSLLVRRSSWETVGGFDERYFPAYYEDVDLCFSIRSLGQTVLCQPRSRVLHHESQSTESDYRRFLMLRNRRIFVGKWTEELRRREAPAPRIDRAISRAVFRARGAPRRLLIVDDRPPHRQLGSGYGVLMDAIESLPRWSWAISVAPTDCAEGDVARLCDLGVQVLRGDPGEILSRPNLLTDVVLVSRPHNFERVMPLVRERHPYAAHVYLAEALFYRRMERQAALAKSAEDRRTLKAEAAHMRELERSIPLAVDHVVCVSYEEAEILAEVAGHCPIDVIPPFMNHVTPTTEDFASRHGLLFVPGWLGGDTTPNVDAIQWFVAEVLPRVREAIPWIRLRVTGGNPPEAVRCLAGPNVQLLGRVPELAPVYASARVVVVPTRFGSGVKVKCLEALQYGVPVVATRVGAEGMHLEGAGVVDVADDPAEFARNVVELHERQELWEGRRALILEWLGTSRVGEEATWEPVLLRAQSNRLESRHAEKSRPARC